MKKLLALVLLVVLAGVGWGQVQYVKQQGEIVYVSKLSTGASLGIWTKINAAKRDTCAAFYILNSGGKLTVTVQCSLKGTSTFSCGYQVCGLGKTFAYRAGNSDSIALCNAVASSGNYPVSVNLPPGAWCRLTFSNPGGDSLFYKIDSSGGIGLVRD